MARSSALRLLAPALAALAAACGDSLLDHRADPALLAPACEAGLLACDGRCIPCTAPANALPACVAGGCGYACGPGFSACGGGCVTESVSFCGPSCQDCTAGLPANATALCTAGACGFQCAPGFIQSGGACVQAAAVTAGAFHTCALLVGGKVACWGANDRGQLGNGGTADSATPVTAALSGATAVAAGYAHTCAIAAGEVWCWGDNGSGELGDGTTVSRNTPVKATAAGFSGATGLAAGGGTRGVAATVYGHTCALAGGALWCWGDNLSGQVGDGTQVSRPAPVHVGGPARTYAAMACGRDHTCALAGGAVYCWGASASGQLGLGLSGAQLTPTAATVAAGATLVAAGEAHSCAAVSGSLQCWGLNSSGQVDPLTAGTSYVAPHTTGGLGGNFPPVLLTAGRAHTCTQRAPPETPKCFGANGSFQLGGVTPPEVTSPTLVAPNSSAQALTGGGSHSCALAGNGVQCWGANDRGQLGRGTVTATEINPAYVSGH